WILHMCLRLLSRKRVYTHIFGFLFQNPLPPSKAYLSYWHWRRKIWSPHHHMLPILCFHVVSNMPFVPEPHSCVVWKFFAIL
ncbi:hypothetical protein ACJX0J_015590, partial [Zea mays]